MSSTLLLWGAVRHIFTHCVSMVAQLHRTAPAWLGCRRTCCLHSSMCMHSLFFFTNKLHMAVTACIYVHHCESTTGPVKGELRPSSRCWEAWLNTSLSQGPYLCSLSYVAGTGALLCFNVLDSTSVCLDHVCIFVGTGLKRLASSAICHTVYRVKTVVVV
jgi:hypothetical protein